MHSKKFRKNIYLRFLIIRIYQKSYIDENISLHQPCA